MLEKISEITRLPIVPLPAVLVPGMILPLHISEPRYRLMLRHCLEGSKLFGLTYHPEAEGGVLVIPETGSIGCAAEILSVTSLPDGCSDVLTVGVCRYRTEGYETQEPYLIAQIDFFEDDPLEEEEIAGLVESASSLFVRFARAVETLRDLPPSPLVLPDDYERLSFTIASVVLSKPRDLLKTLGTRSTKERLEFLQARLESVVEDYEDRAESHLRMRGDGQRRATHYIH